MGNTKETGTRLMLDFGPDGGALIPVVTQDANTREVLILAFANRAALAATRESGYATYWSRSRQEFWKKGATSGNLLKVVEIRVNCEQNSLVYLVEPQGEGACHVPRADGRPHSSCYYRRLVGTGDQLEFLEE